MRKCFLCFAAGLAMAGVLTAGAWRPSGWVWHSWPYQYSAEGAAWHYLQESQDLWGLNLATLEWHRLRDLSVTWMYFAWPYGYVLNTGTWYWMNEANVLWCLNMSSWQWSRYGQDDAPTGPYLVIDLSGGPSASSYPVSYLAAVPSGGWTDDYKTTKLVMRRIPAGTFTMGSPAGEVGREVGETQHQVMLTRDFYIGVFEVTQKQWERVMGNWPAFFNNASCRDGRPVEQVSYNDIRENPNNNGAISPNWPQSSQAHPDSFVGKLRAKTGLATLDIPTEAQWEYACRAGAATALNSGYNLIDDANDVYANQVGRYWYNGGSGHSQGGDTSVGTAEVGRYLANAWGLYDMHGNAGEWCLDWTVPYTGAATDPSGAATGSFRMMRGGSWLVDARGFRSACRQSYWPDYRYAGGGFRLSRTLP